ncbi:CPBP family intramembrane glutamic endopeptidase [Bacillus sp. 2205SS5-2]|uniref:CPBP family intramembrane glutamic endopeptidase n=1 Tax=Bacillus sp. 2205SS5-2 TaxID=3109031 RepID=UPI003004B8C8
MNKRYGYILIIYIVMQLSTSIAVPLIYKLGLNSFGVEDKEKMLYLAAGYWLFISFTLTLIIVLFLLRKSERYEDFGQQHSIPLSISWGVGGIFLAFLAQALAITVESFLGIEPGSENTATAMKIISLVPIALIASSVAGPILEEIVFRQILFGALYKRMPFLAAGFLSSLLFGLAHRELSHILLYTTMGFTFAFLYVHTKRIIVPIIAHVGMNTLVALIQFYPAIMKKVSAQVALFIHWIG